MSDESLTYKTAGVDTGEAEKAIRGFRDTVRSTYSPEVLSDLGLFGGVFSGRFEGFDDPVLVSSIDGVGTKTSVAMMANSFRGIGKDIVNHSVNDILCQSAKPLFFMDYFASSHLRSEIVVEVVEGASEACKEVNCALIGGEIAEMPGTYHEGEFDVVGAIVGVAERARVLPRRDIENGDLLVGLASDGLHTNGFTLARKSLFYKGGRNVSDIIPELGRTLGEELLKPHRCYFCSVYPLLTDDNVIKGIAHITGGSFRGNIIRILPENARAVVEKRTWTIPHIFRMIQEDGGVSDEDMYATFNMGIGMVLICPSEFANAVVQKLNDAGEHANVIGEINSGLRGVVLS